MKALSIMQPWAALIILGVKDIENRTWATGFRGEFLIHTGKTLDTEAYYWLLENFTRMGLPSADVCKIGDFFDRSSPKIMSRGGIVGKAEIVDCVIEHPSPWKSDGSFGFLLRNAEQLAFRPLRGQLGFFEVQE